MIKKLLIIRTLRKITALFIILAILVGIAPSSSAGTDANIDGWCSKDVVITAHVSEGTLDGTSFKIAGILQEGGWVGKTVQ